MRTRSAILIHHHRIAFLSIEISRFNQPAIQFDALGSGEGKELALAEWQFGECSLQFLIVSNRSLSLSVAGTKGDDGRRVQIAPGMDEVFVVFAEYGTAPSCLIGQTLALAIGMSHIDALVARSLFVGCIIDIARGIVDAIDCRHLVTALLHLAQQLSVEVVEIEMHPTIPVAGQQHILVCHSEPAGALLLDVFLRLILDEQLTHRRKRIGLVNAQTVLMAIEREHQYLLRLGCRLDARDIAVGIQWHLQLACLSAGNIKAPYRTLGIVSTSHWIFIGVGTWIFGILIVSRSLSLIERHGILAHLRFVVAHPYQLLAVSRKHHRTIVSELLFVHPVGDAVDDFILASVLRHLALGIVVEQLDEKDVVVAHEGYQRTVLREQWRLLGTVLRQWHQFLVGNGIDVILCLERMAVNQLSIGLNQHAFAVGTHDIAVDTAQFSTMSGRCVEDSLHLLARLER